MLAHRLFVPHLKASAFRAVTYVLAALFAVALQHITYFSK